MASSCIWPELVQVDVPIHREPLSWPYLGPWEKMQTATSSECNRPERPAAAGSNANSLRLLGFVFTTLKNTWPSLGGTSEGSISTCWPGGISMSCTISKGCSKFRRDMVSTSLKCWNGKVRGSGTCCVASAWWFKANNSSVDESATAMKCSCNAQDRKESYDTGSFLMYCFILAFSICLCRFLTCWWAASKCETSGNCAIGSAR